MRSDSLFLSTVFCIVEKQIGGTADNPNGILSGGGCVRFFCSAGKYNTAAGRYNSMIIRKQKSISGSEQPVLRRDDRFLAAEYRRVLFPVMFSVLGGTINALIDSVFVSRSMGASALSAVNLSMPVYLVLCTLGALVSSGGAVLSAQAAGRDNMKKAAELYRTALTCSLLMGLLATLLGLLFLGPLAGLLAGRNSVRSGVEAYCRVTLAGGAVYVVSYIPLRYLQLEGKTAQISRMILLMVATDVALDYVLLYPLRMGLSGAALASVIAMLVSGAYGFIALEQGFSNYRFRRLRLNLRELGEIARYGSPAALGNLCDTGKLLAVNTLILSTGGESAAAVWAVLNTLSELSLVITVGVPRAGNAMLGVYFTARENSGIRTLVRLECVTGTICSCLFAAALAALAGPIGTLFRVSEPMLIPLLCLGLSVVLNTLCCVLETCFNAEGRNALSNVLVAQRRLVFPVAALFGISLLHGVLWLFLPVGGALALGFGLLIPAILSQASRKTKAPLSRVLLLDDTLTRENKVLDFSIPAHIEEACAAAERISDFCAFHGMDAKLVMRLGLSIEELINVIIAKSPEIESVDLRVFALDGTTGIRIRCAGRNYDPFEDEESDDDFLMGIHMLSKMADAAVHTFTLGTNTINIIFRRDENEQS